MNFDGFARQMILKYRLILAVAILKSKPENLSSSQYIEELKTKIHETDMDFDSDVTVCSDDFLMDDEEVAEESKVNGDVEEADMSANILEGFDLQEFVDEENLGEKDLNAQLLEVFDGHPNNGIEEIPINVTTQSTFCESVQSQNLINEFELLQSSLTFCETDRVIDQADFTKANIGTHKQHTIKNITNPTDSTQHKVTREDSQKTQLYSVYGLCEELTHVSESQNDYWTIKNNHLYNKSTYTGVAKTNESIDNAKTYDHPVYTHAEAKNSTETYLSRIQEKDDANKNKTNINQSSLGEINTNVSVFTSKNKISDDFNKTTSNNDIERNHKDIKEVSVNFHLAESLPTVDNTYNVNKFKANNTCYATDFIDHLYIEDDDRVQDSQVDLIPFKVIEELNRVKSYLNRKDANRTTDGYGTDSGYKSDSLGRNSNKMLNSSDAWINQAAHCLLKFLLDCPIVLKTRDISIEISWTLGRLIDKLHDEEKYPSFLEEVLDTVEKLLRNIYEGDSYVDDVILRKDVEIHRLFHLNRSHHILKYTIDKITQILENFLTLITEDNTLEISNTVQMENLSYIFHILGYLIKRLAVTKDILSQNSTQTTQEEDRSLKRSSLTDVWRRKWNPNYKPESQQLNSQTKCSETKCIEVLNRIIVKSMDGYSLISFAALQCYNLLQH